MHGEKFCPYGVDAVEVERGGTLNLLRRASPAPTLAADELLRSQRPPVLPCPRPSRPPTTSSIASDCLSLLPASHLCGSEVLRGLGMMSSRHRPGRAPAATAAIEALFDRDPLLLPSSAAARPPPTWRQGQQRQPDLLCGGICDDVHPKRFIALGHFGVLHGWVSPSNTMVLVVLWQPRTIDDRFREGISDGAMGVRERGNNWFRYIARWVVKHVKGLFRFAESDHQHHLRTGATPVWFNLSMKTSFLFWRS
ncbi:hypothetical protein EJB05_10623, partial [Eragrostis curvula]